MSKIEEKRETFREPPWELKPPPDWAPPCSVDEDGEIRFPIIRQNGESLQNFHPPPQCMNICKQFFTRDLGVHGVAKNYPLLFNSIMESKGSRALIDKRAGTSMDIRNILGRVLTPKLILLPLGGQRPNNPEVRKQNREAEQMNWFQIDLPQFGGTEVGKADNLLWSCSINRREKVNLPEERFLLQFYAYTPNNLELVVVASKPIMGTILQAQVLNYTSTLDNKPYQFLILLNDASQLLAFDLLARKTTDLLRLDVGDEDHSIENFAILEKEEKILVFKEDDIGDLVHVIVFPYPPGWQVVTMIDFEHLRVDLTLRDGYCLMFQGVLEFTIASWENVYERAVQVPVTIAAPNPLLSVGQQLRVTGLPQSNIQITPTSVWAGFLNTDPPLVVTEVPNGLDFYCALPSIAIAEPTVYRVRGRNDDYFDDEDKTNAIAFPDHSPRVLVSTQKTNRYQVLTFRRITRPDGTEAVVGARSFPFNDFSHHTHRDYQTGIVSPITRKKSVLGMAACSKGVKLLAVVFGEGNRFNVNIYDVSSPKLIRFRKALPIVRRTTSSNFKVDSISRTFMSFDPDQIFIEFTFELKREHTFKEVYICPILLETF